MESRTADGLNETDKIFLKEKPSMAIVTIRRSRGDIYSRVVSKQIDCTYAHTVKMISKMNDGNLVMLRDKGRKKILELTEKGEKYADVLLDLMENERRLEVENSI